MAITIALVVYEPTKVVRGAGITRLINSAAQFTAYTDLVRAPGIAAPEVTLREELLRRANAEPTDRPEVRCGTRAFQSALSSIYGPRSIATAVCAGYYGIGRIRKTGTATSESIGFFAVDSTGRWRLVGTVPDADNLEQTLPDGFPALLLERWANR